MGFFETDEERSYFLIRLLAHEDLVPGDQTAPEVTGEVTGEIQRLLTVLRGEMKRVDLQDALGLKHEDHFRDTYLRPALDAGLIEMTIPDKPRSRLQKYRLTPSGKQVLAGKEQNA